MNGWLKKKIQMKNKQQNEKVVYLNDSWRNLTFLELKNIVSKRCMSDQRRNSLT